MITVLRFHLFIICSFIVISLSLGGCSSSNVTNETSEEPTADGFLGEDEDGLGLADEEENGEFEEGDLADELPEDTPLDFEDDAPPLAEDGTGLPELPVTEGEGGLPEAPIADGEIGDDSGLPSLPIGDQDQSQFASEESYSPPFDDSGAFAQAPRRIPVKKIKSYPYNRAGMLVNAVYIARSGDDLFSISQKIYGADRTADLLAINPNLQRGVDVGDKVYYNSPNRPTDSQNLLFYYEDIGASSQQYTVGRGENIRDIAQQLFGERESWKELWATNFEVESKWALDEGIALRYWDGSVSAAVPLPQQQPPASEVVQEEVIQEEIVQENNFESLPPQEEAPDLAGAAGNEFPPGSETGSQDGVADDFAGGGNELAPPPTQPAPPPVAAMGDQEQDDAVGNLLEDEQSLLFLVAGIVVIMLMLMIAVRRKAKRRKMRVNIGDTQI